MQAVSSVHLLSENKTKAISDGVMGTLFGAGPKDFL
jgi:hypothetical protein